MSHERTNCEAHFHDGILCTLNRVLGKLEKFLYHEKSIPKALPAPAIEMAIDPVHYWCNSNDSLNEACLDLDSPILAWEQYDTGNEEVECTQLSELIESVLKEAKSGPLRCGELLVPTHLTVQVARDMIRLSQDEPCGLRGCVLLMNYEDQLGCRRIGHLQYDPATVPTFELVLTLKKDTNSWLSFRYMLPFRGCFRKFGKGPTIVVSPGYTLVKKKLYRSTLDS